ncbi:MAG: GNAT family N-acetyltransferase, partial [Leucothrix sp.]
FRSFSNKPNTGYVHLIYLVQGFRGLGVADEAQKFVFQVLREQGCQAAMLSVSRANERAVRHYTRTGWSYLAPNPKHELTDFYTRQFS